MSDIVETRFLLTVKRDDWGESDRAFLNLSVAPVGVTAAGELRNYLGDGFTPEPLADLQINAQADYVSDAAYGWRVEYRDVFSVDLRRAQSMVKTLKRIDSGLAKLDARYGRAESFGAYVLRVADVLKVDSFGWKADPKQDWDGTGYRWANADSFAYHLATVVSDFHRARERETA